ncbi:YhgE/Pip domain-containing protein [Corynebacterium uterequi]|uniref:Protein with YhgE/Pip N-terminal domain n=1 Tax=Corynebacterium uterequi TaxID=1072256 RepID=A0A0G3HF64_9CORY|nr:YhgE/Pip family protein [Corynebacterium uterequi]AKK11991.1 protein with YhgE/Pip N-terminal domain [Corynebacterium uterequi]
MSRSQHARRGARLRPPLIVGLLVLPITVAMVYMWAMWDPTPYLRTVPLAVVNEDAGLPGGDNHGRTVVEGLLATDYLHFEEVSAAEADAGLKHTDYLFTVRIPKDFSAATQSVISENPRHPTIEITENDFNGTAGAFLTSGLLPEVEAKINTAVSTTYAERVLGGLNQLGEGIAAGADGAERVNDGVTRLADGSATLADGTGRLTEATTRLTEGSAKLVDGTALVEQGSQRLAEGGHRLIDGTDQMADGMSQISGGISELNTHLLPLVDSAQGLSPFLGALAPVLDGVGRADDAQRMRDIAAKFDPANPDNLATSLRRLEDGAHLVHTNLSDPQSAYRGGLNQLVDGMDSLEQGTARVAEGQRSLNAGLSALDDGAVRLHDGATRLDDGVGELGEGTARLATGLRDGADRAPHVVNLSASAEQIGAPITFEHTNLNPAKSIVDPADPTVRVADSGASLLILLVFGFLLTFLASLLLPGLRHRATIAAALRSWAVHVGVGGAITAVLAGLAGTLGWSPANPVAMAVALGLVVATNAAVLVFFSTILDRVLAGIASLAAFFLGLFSFGGIWPEYTTPAAFRLLRPLHWMSYQREGFVAASQGTLGGGYAIGVAGMLAWLLIVGGVTVVIMAARARRAAAARAEVLAAVDAIEAGADPLLLVGDEEVSEPLNGVLQLGRPR